MVSDRVYSKQRRIVVLKDARDVTVERLTNGIGDERTTLLRGENQMDQNVGEGLWHLWSCGSGSPFQGLGLSTLGTQGLLRCTLGFSGAPLWG